MQVPIAEVQAGELTLAADLDDAALELAKHGFKAEVIAGNCQPDNIIPNRPIVA